MHSYERLSDVPVDVLCRLRREQGPDLLRGGERCGAMLADMCGAYRREVFILDSVIRKGLFAAKPQAGIPLDMALSKLAQQISEQLRFDADAATWAASAWALLYDPSLTNPAENNPTRSRSSVASDEVHIAQSQDTLHRLIAAVVRAFSKDLGEVRYLANLHESLLASVARDSSPASEDVSITTILFPSFSGVERGLVLTDRTIHFVNLDGDGQHPLISWSFRALQTTALQTPRLGRISLGAISGVVALTGTGVQSRTLMTFLGVLREVIAPFSDALPATIPHNTASKPSRRTGT